MKEKNIQGLESENNYLGGEGMEYYTEKQNDQRECEEGNEMKINQVTERIHKKYIHSWGEDSTEEYSKRQYVDKYNCNFDIPFEHVDNDDSELMILKMIEMLKRESMSFADVCVILEYISKSLEITMSGIDENNIILKCLLSEKKVCIAEEVLGYIKTQDELLVRNLKNFLDFLYYELKRRSDNAKLW